MTNPTSDPTLHPDLRRAIRAAIQSRPDAYMRSRVMYNIVRECYDAITALAPGADTDERSSAGQVSDAALLHEDRMRDASGLLP